MKIYLISFFIATSIFSLSLFTSDFQQNESIVFHPESTELQYDEIQIKLYPNPASNFVSLEVPNTVEIEKLIIYDITGKLITTINLSSSQSRIDISNLHSGQYMAIILDKSGKQAIKRLYKK